MALETRNIKKKSRFNCLILNPRGRSLSNVEREIALPLFATRCN
jgi:DNA-binding winged helix-turn-helix (wHTH) protein